MLSTNVEIARNRAFDCRLSPDWQQMAIENNVSSYLWSALIDCSERFRLPPVRYDKGACFMLIETVWSFLHKTLATIYLNLQTMSISGLLCRCSPLLPCINDNEALGQWFVALRHVKYRWKVQLSAIETRQVSIVNTHNVYINENHNVMCWVTYARSKSFLSFSTPILQCIINNSYVSAQWYT